MSENIPLVKISTNVRNVPLSDAVKDALSAWFDYASEGRDLDIRIRYSRDDVGTDGMIRKITVWLAGDKP